MCTPSLKKTEIQDAARLSERILSVALRAKVVTACSTSSKLVSNFPNDLVVQQLFLVIEFSSRDIQEIPLSSVIVFKPLTLIALRIHESLQFFNNFALYMP